MEIEVCPNFDLLFLSGGGNDQQFFELTDFLLMENDKNRPVCDQVYNFDVFILEKLFLDG